MEGSTMNTTNGTVNSVNRIAGAKGKGKAKARGGRRAAPPALASGLKKLRSSITIGMGCAIPLLSLSLSHCAGNLARAGHSTLAAFAAFIMTAVLAVSLSHLAWAVGDITKSGPRSSWLLAIAFDLSLVAGELIHVYAPDCGVWGVATAIMVVVCLFSMLLNVYAFLMHK